MTIRHGEARWQGSLKQGSGRLRLGSGVFEGAYSFPSRFETGAGTNPEELIAAAHAACFSMALAAILERAGLAPTRIRTGARVHLGLGEAGPAITRIEIDTAGEVPGLDDAGFEAHARTAKATCLVSRALSVIPITLTARLDAVDAIPTVEGP
ncbi:OsmC family protein [Labrys wisconsinensis]|uniref:Osmotically inducible protein OsmC n=1 Tax=Labrys wisconsinensis TaxID=425677 RepID=A0ABU0J6B5_9HYPH|nr:OsmC family protein [Labrys wisconsinensis]MDQ0469790.1 osmotically inducible protein OsmC [Labrys wisconsinensis]